jgi:Phosphotransferase enzyme family
MTLTEEYVRDVLDGPGWQISELRGSQGKTRLASRGDEAVVVKQVDTPLAVMNRLSELGVTPAVLASGTHEGVPYLVQQVVTGPSPDHAWFAANVEPWAAMVGRYLNDEPLRGLVAAVPPFWRLAVPDAVALIDSQPAPRVAALREPAFATLIGRWRAQSAEIVRLPLRPIHPDPHWHNYVVADGRAYLLDWEYIDLSDPLRDVGYQVWGFLPRSLWATFLRGVGLEPSEELELAIFWWAAFKLALFAFYNDTCDDQAGAEFHVELLRAAVARRPWVD